MSHSVKLTIALNTKHEIKVCDSITKTIEKFPKEYKETFAHEISLIEKSINELRTFALSIDNLMVDIDVQNSMLEYQRKLDGIKKRINNIKSINLGEYISIVSKEEMKKLEEIIVSNGIIASLSLQQLKEEGKQISEESLMERINLIRNKELSGNILKAEITKIEDFIFDGGFHEEIEDYLLEFVEKSNSPQVLADLYAMVGAMDIEKVRITELHIQVSEILNEIGFKQTKLLNTINDEGTLKTVATYKNKLNKEFKMTFKAIGIDYQMGNYDKHLCESDSKNFREILTKQLKVSDVRIVRNISNERPMLRQISSKKKEA